MQEGDEPAMKASRTASGVVKGNETSHVGDIGSRNDMTAMRCCEDMVDYGACIGRVAVRAGTGAERTQAEAGCR